MKHTASLPASLFLLGSLLLGSILSSTLLLAGCEGAPPPAEEIRAAALETEADSAAMRMYEAHGGPAVWKDTPALVFSFAGGRIEGPDTTRHRVARHWWRRTDGQYRVEWTAGPGMEYTAVFDARTIDPDRPPSGQAALNGTVLDSAAAADALTKAQERFANDTYWLLAPLKLFDEGVHRAMAPLPPPARPDSSAADGSAADGSAADSSAADSSAGEPEEVLHLSFADVGITSEDQYWLTPDPETGRLARWAFHLQGMGPEQAPGVFDWTGYEAAETPAGTLMLSTRKENTGGPQVLFTDEIRMPATLPDSLFSLR